MNDQYYFAEDCPNCGEKDEYMSWKGARQSSTDWGHGHSCCSDACGKRLAKKIDSGMVDLLRYPNNRYLVDDVCNKTRIDSLRIRIKILENKLRNKYV